MARKKNRKPRIAFLFRYGAQANVELAHATPWIIEQVAAKTKIHFFGPRDRGETPPCIDEHTVYHSMPWSVDRSSSMDKLFKTLLWYLALPLLGLRCRLMRISVVYIDDFLPMGSLIVRFFSGAKVAIFVVDFLVDVYARKHPLLKPLAWLVNAVDFASWRRLPLIFTRTHHGKAFLAGIGVPEEHVRVVYDACDMQLYHPDDREDSRAQWGYSEKHVVLAHHGVLHPNKALDRVFRFLAPLMREDPRLRLLIIGSGPELETLRGLATELQIGKNVQFTGWLPTADDVCAALNAADIGLVMRAGDPTDHFHLTGALVHAMAIGLPILGPRLAGIGEVVKEGESGLLFDPNDAEECRAKCRQLAEDPDAREKMGREGLRLANELFEVKNAARCVSGPLLELAGRGEADVPPTAPPETAS